MREHGTTVRSLRGPRRGVWRDTPLGLLLVLAAGCAPEDGAHGGLDAFQLHRRTLSAGRFEVIALEDALSERASRLAASLGSVAGVEARALGPGAGEAGAATAGAIRVVLGTARDRLVQELAAPLGLAVDGDGFELLGRRHGLPSDWFVATLADPDRPGIPLVLFAGNDAALLAGSIAEVPAPWRPRLATVFDGAPGLEVELRPDGTPRPETLVDHVAARERSARDDDLRTYSARGFVLEAPRTLDAKLVQTYLERARSVLARAVRWLGTSSTEPPLTVRLHGSLSEMQLASGVARLSHLDPVRGRLDVLVLPGLLGDGGAALAEAVARRVLGPPVRPWVARAFGVAAAGTWWGRPLAQWCARLQWAGLVPDAAVLPDAGGALGEHVREPALAFLVQRRLGTEEGRARWPAVWRGERAFECNARLLTPRELERMKPALRRERREHVARALPPALRGRREGAAASERLGRGGMFLMLSPEAVQPEIEATLRRVHRIGADLAAVTVQASRSPHATALRLGGELYRTSSDAEVAELLLRARSLGMRTVLCAEPLASPGGTWGDGGKLVEDEDTRRFFAGMRRVATHYALLSELLRVDVLSIGTGLETASNTVLREADTPWLRAAKERRAAGWRALLAGTRPLFDGALTYTARSKAEAEGCAFLGDLDLVALRLFGSLEGKESRESAERLDSTLRYRLRRELEEARALGDAVGRPVVVLGVGFPARAGSLATPDVPRGAPDEGLQDRFYLGLAEALRVTSPDQLPQGLCLWDFGSDLGAGEASAGGTVYTPLGRPAERRLRRILRGPSR